MNGIETAGLQEAERSRLLDLAYVQIRNVHAYRRAYLILGNAGAIFVTTQENMYPVLSSMMVSQRRPMSRCPSRPTTGGAHRFLPTLASFSLAS